MARAFGDLGPAEIRFVGAASGLEHRLVPAHGFELEVVETPTVRGRSPLALPRIGIRVVRSLAAMRRLLREFRPDAVFGTGGAVSGIAVVAARLGGIPSLILEPNAEPGLATRWSAAFASEVAVAWAPTRRYFRRPATVSGIPVRPEFFGVAPAPSRNGSLSVLITGGSQGASRLNRLVIEALPALRRCSGLRITHQTGPRETERVRRAYRDADFEDARVESYLDDMPRAMEAADLVVGRAGAITCAELSAAGRPAILVPTPVAGAHQRQNAAAMVEAGAALMMDQESPGGTVRGGGRRSRRRPGTPGRHGARGGGKLAHRRTAEQLAERLRALGEGAA